MKEAFNSHVQVNCAVCVPVIRLRLRIDSYKYYGVWFKRKARGEVLFAPWYSSISSLVHPSLSADVKSSCKWTILTADIGGNYQSTMDSPLIVMPVFCRCNGNKASNGFCQYHRSHWCQANANTNMLQMADHLIAMHEGETKKWQQVMFTHLYRDGLCSGGLYKLQFW